MTTATKTEGCRKTKRTMTTELVCPCGNRLTVSVDKKGWLTSLWAVGLANRWIVELSKIVESGWQDHFEAQCPKCLDEKPSQCQCRDC